MSLTMAADEDQHPPHDSLALVLEHNAGIVSATLRQTADASPPMTALLAARTAADAVEQATRVFVEEARAGGKTWQEIGELLAITRQAAQQRFGQTPPDPEHAALAQRACEVVGQVDAGDWERVTEDWDDVMRAERGRERLAEAWSNITASAGRLQTIGRSTIARRGPYRIADVPLVFTHGPMKARVVFNHDGQISGLFVLLPDAP